MINPHTLTNTIVALVMIGLMAWLIFEAAGIMRRAEGMVRQMKCNPDR